MYPIIEYILSLPYVLSYPLMFVLGLIPMLVSSTILLKKLVFKNTAKNLREIILKILIIILIEFILAIIWQIVFGLSVISKVSELAGSVLAIWFFFNFMSVGILIAIIFSTIVIIKSLRYTKKKSTNTR